MKRHKEEQKSPALMIIPMIDIIFFLLVFFMINTIYAVPQQSLSIELPKTKTQQSVELKPAIIDYEKSGQFMIDDSYVTMPQLIESVTKKVAARPDQNFLIRADEELTYGKVVELMDEMKQVGVTNISIATVTK